MYFMIYYDIQDEEWNYSDCRLQYFFMVFNMLASYFHENLWKLTLG